MKKSLSLLIGALLLAMLPVGNAMAQSKTVQVTARTLDRVPLVSATIYGDTVTGLTYFVDSANFDASYVGAISVDSMPYSATLSIVPGDDNSNTTASGTVDSATYATSVIVLRDANNKVYVLGNVSPANRAMGVFQATNLMMGNTMDYTASAQMNMMVGNALINNRGYSYSTILGASTYATEGDTLRVNGNIAPGIIDSVVNPVVLNLATDTINGQLQICHSFGTVTVMGGKINNIAGDANNAPVALKGIDSLGSYNPGQHATTIESGHYGILYPASGVPLTISGGVFANSYPGYCANRFSFGQNLGADSTIYPYAIVPGYTVTWVNWDFLGGIKTTINDQPDNLIKPVLASPFAATSDTIIVGRFSDAGFTTPWNFLHDTLSSDTSIYVKWDVRGAGEARYYVVNNKYDHMNVLDFSDTLVCIDSIGHRVVVYRSTYPYYTCNIDSIVIPSLNNNDTVLQFDYYRNFYSLSWNLNGGQFTDGFGTTQNIRWGTTIDYTHTPVLEGHNFIGWLPNNYTTMPHFDLTLNAQYVVKYYGLTWTGVGGSTPYTGQAIDNISATYTDDNGNTVDAILRFKDNNGNTLSQIVEPGIYTVIASSPNPSYHFNSDTVRAIIIVPATLTVVGTTVKSIKMYDGSYNADVVNPGTLNTVYGSDDVQLTTTARFTDATPGSGKTIVAHYTISGNDVAKYVLDTSYATIRINDATIIGFNMEVNGYCDTVVSVKFNDVVDNTLQYSLTFAAEDVAQGFTSDPAGVWHNFTFDGTDAVANIAIPDDALSKDYTVKMLIKDAMYTSDSISINFHLNLDKDYVVAIFADVMTIVNKGQLDDFPYIQWYRDDIIVPGATGQYYQDPDGTTAGHTYYVVLSNDNGESTRTCPQSMVDVPAEDDVLDPEVNTYPNPTKDILNVNVKGAKTQHTMCVMNVMGQVMMNTTFEGDEANVDMSGFAQGTYIVNVDGVTVRVIKK